MSSQDTDPYAQESEDEEQNSSSEQRESEALMFDFVEEIKSRPGIWNKSYEEFKNQLWRMQQFEEIIKSLQEMGHPLESLVKEKLVTPTGKNAGTLAQRKYTKKAHCLTDVKLE